MKNALFHALEGENIKFEQMTLEDREALHSFASDSEVSRLIPTITPKGNASRVFCYIISKR
ncbi:hypothetical protein [Wukongibacter sp. M2B1]|uniref:hypothetical protein n=1 Tax=Wukongibacter sp. M2B1 TaxID=3088895 RepID=UPI003D79A3B4